MLLNHLNVDRFFDSLSANDAKTFRHAGRECEAWIQADINYIDTSITNNSLHILNDIIKIL